MSASRRSETHTPWWRLARGAPGRPQVTSAVVAARSKHGGDPTRRFHVPSAVRGSPARIDPATARDLVVGGAALVDVRRHDDPAMSLDGALRISPEEIPDRLDELSRDSPIVLACG
jgi:hypothetical protein